MEIYLGDGQTVRFDGRVSSCIPQQDSDQIMCEVEVVFDDMPEEGMEKIWEYIYSQG